MSEPTATQIIAGPATLYVAPVGTTLPATSSPATWPPVWPAGWAKVGYTEKGVDFIYTPTIKGFTPDEEATEVYDILEKIKAEISTTLWEATIENYNTAISSGVFTDDGAVRKLAVGGLVLRYLAIGFQGPAPVSDSMSSPASTPTGRVIIMQKAIVTSAVSVNMSRQDIQKFAVKWDARKIAGQDLYDLFEYYHL
jgi:hypothetical protein